MHSFVKLKWMRPHERASINIPNGCCCYFSFSSSIFIATIFRCEQTVNIWCDRYVSMSEKEREEISHSKKREKADQMHKIQIKFGIISRVYWFEWEKISPNENKNKHNIDFHVNSRMWPKFICDDKKNICIRYIKIDRSKRIRFRRCACVVFFCRCLIVVAKNRDPRSSILN